jgi:hypothetical protein
MEDDKNDKLYKNLVILLKIFKDRPNHLAKYLIDNNTFKIEFIEKLINSEKLNGMISEEDYNYFNEMEDNLELPIFTDYQEMTEYYNSIISDNYNQSDTAREKNTIELNNKLNKLIEIEEFEEAARLRDYMVKNNYRFL